MTCHVRGNKGRNGDLLWQIAISSYPDQK